MPDLLAPLGATFGQRYRCGKLQPPAALTRAVQNCAALHCAALCCAALRCTVLGAHSLAHTSGHVGASLLAHFSAGSLAPSRPLSAKRAPSPLAPPGPGLRRTHCVGRPSLAPWLVSLLKGASLQLPAVISNARGRKCISGRSHPASWPEAGRRVYCCAIITLFGAPKL